ncbi:small multidrug resistance pump [Acidovorax delafieldii]|uniref:DMT family transporter n=1 Tax=Acidovorax delafieldii TaxID=47920 RepID=UPI002866AA17|nr:multidrug efflux SMR transporter [Acidovorax delafieldii]MDR6154622.1 small multidrug resistance pump [Acidovorax delafieldii]
MRDSTFAWLVLAGSVLAEVVGTIALRYSDGFTRIFPSVLSGLCYSAAIWLMAIAVRHMEVGLTYAVWAGSGTALTAVLGMLWFGESASFLRLAGLSFIVLGVIALNLSAR